MGIAFRARGGERYLGFGERSNAVDQRGHEVENYVAEGPYQADERAVRSRAFVPPWGFHPRDDATYFPMPWLLSTARLRRAGRQRRDELLPARRPTRGAWSVEVDGAPTAARCASFAGPRPADVAAPAHRARSAASRRRRRRSFFGPWYQPTAATSRRSLDALRRRDAPLSVAQTYTHYLPCGDQQGTPRRRARARRPRFHAAGLRGHDLLQPDDLHRLHAALRRGRGGGRADRERRPAQPYVYRYIDARRASSSASSTSPRRPAGRSTASCSSEALADGHDGWMEDFGEYTPLDARSRRRHDRRPRCTTVYPRHYHCAACDCARARGAAARALHPLGLDRRRALRADRLGRRPDRPTGASTACARRCTQRADDGAVGRQRSGARTSAASSRCSSNAADARAARRAGSRSAPSRA